MADITTVQILSSSAQDGYSVQTAINALPQGTTSVLVSIAQYNALSSQLGTPTTGSSTYQTSNCTVILNGISINGMIAAPLPDHLLSKLTANGGFFDPATQATGVSGPAQQGV